MCIRDSPNMAIFVNDFSFPAKSEHNVEDIQKNQQGLKKEKESFVEKNKLRLTSNEKDSFRQHYIPESISFDVKPNIIQHTKGVKVPHCKKVSEVISLFNDERNDNKKRTIDMNYIKCLAKSMLRDTQDLWKSGDKNPVDNSISHDSSQSLILSNAELDDILGSDSDF